MPETIEHTMTTYVSDMHAVVQEALRPLDAQCKDEYALAIPEAASLLPRLKQTLEQQSMRLENRLQELGGHELSGLKNAVAAVLGTGGAAVDKLRTRGRVAKILRDDQTALGLMSISYELLHTTALGLNDQGTARLAQKALEEITPFVMAISNCVPAVVINELRQDGLTVNTAAIDQAREEHRRAWSKQPTST